MDNFYKNALDYFNLQLSQQGDLVFFENGREGWSEVVSLRDVFCFLRRDVYWGAADFFSSLTEGEGTKINLSTRESWSLARIINTRKNLSSWAVDRPWKIALLKILKNTLILMILNELEITPVNDPEEFSEPKDFIRLRLPGEAGCFHFPARAIQELAI